MPPEGSPIQTAVTLGTPAFLHVRQREEEIPRRGTSWGGVGGCIDHPEQRLHAGDGLEVLSGSQNVHMQCFKSTFN